MSSQLTMMAASRMTSTQFYHEAVAESKRAEAVDALVGTLADACDPAV